MFFAIFSDITLPVKWSRAFHLDCLEKRSIVVPIPMISLFRSISSRLVGLGVSSCTTSAFSFSLDFQLNGLNKY